MKTEEELNALKEEVETLSKKLAELSEDELKQVAGGGQYSGDLSSEDVYKAMFNYITKQDEFHAVYVYRSKGYLLDTVDRVKAHSLFRQIFGYEIEESPYNK